MLPQAFIILECGADFQSAKSPDTESCGNTLKAWFSRCPWLGRLEEVRSTLRAYFGRGQARCLCKNSKVPTP
jgi:hypothetical protein